MATTTKKHQSTRSRKTKAVETAPAKPKRARKTREVPPFVDPPAILHVPPVEAPAVEAPAAVLSVDDIPLVLPEPRTQTAAESLRGQTMGTRVTLSVFGTHRAVSAVCREDMARSVEADGRDVSARKRLLNSKHPAFLACTNLRNRAETYWKQHTLPYPEIGTRLIKLTKVGDFEAQMTAFRDEMADLSRALDDHLQDLRDEAQRRLGKLFDPRDYPETMADSFRVGWTVFSVEPPSYLLDLHPEVYHAEQERAAARFTEAVHLAEQAFVTQFAELIGHLCDKLTGTSEDGRPLVFRDSAVNNIHDFVNRFGELTIHSMPELDALVARAKDAISGHSPNQFRTDGAFRAKIVNDLRSVSVQIDGLMIERPRRRIIRPDVVTQDAPDVTQDTTPAQDETPTPEA
jgi:hypothetical protein